MALEDSFEENYPTPAPNGKIQKIAKKELYIAKRELIEKLLADSSFTRPLRTHVFKRMNITNIEDIDSERMNLLAVAVDSDGANILQSKNFRGIRYELKTLLYYPKETNRSAIYASIGREIHTEYGQLEIADEMVTRQLKLVSRVSRELLRDNIHREARTVYMPIYQSQAKDAPNMDELIEREEMRLKRALDELFLEQPESETLKPEELNPKDWRYDIPDKNIALN